MRALFATLPDRARAILHWYGPGRAIMSAGSVLVVCVGAWWLLRAPAPPLENSLPMANPVVVSSSSLDMSMSSVGLSSVGMSAAGVSPLAAGLITVHVVGAVVQPGVYRLPAGSRVIDAVDLAGGVKDNADTESVNMALPLGDADQVFIPTRSAKGTSASRTTVSAVRKSPRANDTSGVATSTPSTGSSSASGAVNVNTADAAALEALPGVGPATAKAIIDHRATNGPFASVEDLKKVKGIGETKFAALRPFVTV